MHVHGDLLLRQTAEQPIAARISVEHLIFFRAGTVGDYAVRCQWKALGVLTPELPYLISSASSLVVAPNSTSYHMALRMAKLHARPSPSTHEKYHIQFALS
jgi:hypothetical protein